MQGEDGVALRMALMTATIFMRLGRAPTAQSMEAMATGAASGRPFPVYPLTRGRKFLIPFVDHFSHLFTGDRVLLI